MKIPCILVFAMNIVAIGCAAQDVAIELDGCESEQILSYLVPRASFRELDAQNLAEHCGESVLPVLTELLDDKDVPPRTQAMIAMCISKLGVSGSEQVLIRNIQRARATPVVSREERVCLAFVIYSLGFLGNKESVEFLRELCTKSYWLNREDLAMIAPDRRTLKAGELAYDIDQWRSCAIAALANSKSKEALDLLLEFRSSKEVQDIANDKTLDAHIQILRDRIDGKNLESEYNFSE